MGNPSDPAVWLVRVHARALKLADETARPEAVHARIDAERAILVEHQPWIDRRTLGSTVKAKERPRPLCGRCVREWNMDDDEDPPWRMDGPVLWPCRTVRLFC